VAGGWTRPHAKELCNLYSSPNDRAIKWRTMRWVGHVSCMEEMRNTYKILVEEPGTKRVLVRLRRRSETKGKVKLSGYTMP